ncbi:diaminobutyrate acetyltransferase [Microbacterium sp. MC2]
MTQISEASHARTPNPAGVRIAPPALTHGAGMWRVARDSGELDLNSSYMYVLFARDFAATCRVALDGDDVVAFVLGYRRPDEPECLLVWQIAVDATHRGQGLAGRLLDDLLATAVPPVAMLETTITDDNAASQRLFAAFARRHDAGHEVTPLIEAAHFPDDHDPERLHRIGPLAAPRSGDRSPTA